MRRMIALLDGEDEERVALVDPVVGEPLEERLERGVVALQVRLVARVARALGRAAVRAPRLRVSTGDLFLVGVGDVAVRDRDSDLLHVGR